MTAPRNLEGRYLCCSGYGEHADWCATGANEARQRADRYTALRQCHREQRDARRRAEVASAVDPTETWTAADEAARLGDLGAYDDPDATYSHSVGAGASFMERGRS